MISQLEEEQVERVLQSHHIGRVGCIADGRPYVVPITYVYDEGCVYGHTGEGMKITGMRQNPEVCFETDDVQDMTRWQSVIAWGRYEELSGKDADRAQELMVKALAPYATSKTFFGDEREPPDYKSRGFRAPARKGIFYRIHLTEKTGRYEKT